MRVLVTGSRGFIGSALSERLRARGISFDRVVRSKVPVKRSCLLGSRWHVSWPDGLADIDYSRYSAIIHLALGKETIASTRDAISGHVQPVRAIEAGIEKRNPDCHLIFLSSLSATAQATSAYGKGKFRVHQLLEASRIRFTILRPGLVVSGNGGAGLFGAIATVIRLSPIVPVPSGPGTAVQVVVLSDLLDAIEIILRRPANFNGQVVPLALPGRGLLQLVRDTAIELGVRRWIVPIPITLTYALLALVKRLLPAFPISRGNLDGLIEGDAVDSTESLKRLDLSLSVFGVPDESCTEPQRLAWEAHYLSNLFFKKIPTDHIVKRYIAAHASMPHLRASPQLDLARLLRRGIDLEAMEIATRAATPTLSEKFHLLSLLCECDPKYEEDFILSRPSRLTAWSVLGVSTLVSVLRGIRGNIERRLLHILPSVEFPDDH